MENISIKSIMLYIMKKYRWLGITAIAGMLCLSGLNIMKGPNYADHVTDTDSTTKEELEDAQDAFKTAQDNLEASEQKLISQQELLKKYESTLETYQDKWDKDAYMETSASNRYAVSTVYQFSGTNEAEVRQALNALKAALGNMYEEIAAGITSQDMTSYNAEQLFKTEVNLNQNQVVIKTSCETEDGLNELVELYHAWIEKKLEKYREDYPNANISMRLIEENRYNYYDSDIFSQQAAAVDKDISLKNSIISTKNAIASTKNEIVTNKTKVADAKAKLKKTEKLWNNTIEISEESGKTISKSSVIIYLILGAVLGIVCCGGFWAFVYMYGTKLHDSQDLECKIGEKTIGTLYTPVYKGKSVILRKLDQWSGIQEIENVDLQYQKIAIDISLIMKHFGKNKMVLTGTVERTDLEKVQAELEKYVNDIKIVVGGNPLYDVNSSRMLLDTDAVVILEKIGSSRISEIRKLKEYLDQCGIQILGGITE